MKITITSTPASADDAPQQLDVSEAQATGWVTVTVGHGKYSEQSIDVQMDELIGVLTFLKRKEAP